MSDATKFTPGPWRAGFESQADRKHTMLVRAEEVDGQPWVAICRSNFGDIPIEANARLIASAPDLLAACRAALAMLAERGDPFAGPDWELGHRLSAAIGKATDPDYPEGGVER